ncbi:AEC family transporter [bacterium]|nr:AEC family transporter [bacterium]
MEFRLLAETILGFVALVGVGTLLRRFGALSHDDARPINSVIVYAGLPALIFRAVHGADLGADLALVAGLAWAVFAVSALVAWWLSRVLRLERHVAGGFVLATALGNTGFVGYPLAEALLGPTGLVRAVFYDVFGTVGALVVVGLFIAEHYGAPGGRRVNPLREVLTFPAVIALAVALALRSVTLPVLVSDWIDLLANLVVPLIMISVGLSLRPRALRDFAVPLALVAGIKLVLAPLAALALGTLVLSDADAVRAVVLEAGMPSMMLTLVVGARFRLETDFIAAAILVTTVASAVTIPLVQLLVG